MPRKNLALQRGRRRVVYWAARALQLVVLCLPYNLAIRLGAGLGRMAFVILRRARRETIAHLTLAFGREKSPEELRRIAGRVFVNAGRALAEIMLLPHCSNERLDKTVQFDNPGPLKESSQSGRGQVILTAHLGNWEMLGAYGARILGLNAGVIARSLSNPYIDEWVNGYRRKAGLKVFLRGESVRGFFRHLVGGGTLALLGDHDIYGIDGVFVDFFGRPAHTAIGPAELILRARSDWFFAVMVRQPNGQGYRVHCEGPLPVPAGPDHATRVRLLTEDYTRRVEAVVREYPDQWMWMHNRWRKQPKRRAKQLEGKPA